LCQSAALRLQAVLSQRSLMHSDPPAADPISLLIIRSAIDKGWAEKLPDPSTN